MPKFHPLTSYKTGRRPCNIFRVLLYRLSQQFQIRFSKMFSFLHTAPARCYSTVFHLPSLHHSREVFLYILQHIQHMVQHNTGHTRPTICVHKLFVVDHCIMLRNTMAIVKDRSHINQTPSITLVYYFLINSPDQDLHHPSRFRVYVFLLDIFSRTICSLIYYIQFYHSRVCNTCKAEAVKP